MEWIDRDSRRRGDRSDFRTFLDQVEAKLAAGDRPLVVAAELPLLFRRRADREHLAALLDRGLDIGLARERLWTDSAEGRARYEQAADIVLLAHQGRRDPFLTPAPRDRAELVDRYVDRVLLPQLMLWGAPEDLAVSAATDVRARLKALVARLDNPALSLPLLAAYRELAEQHEPKLTS